MTEALLQAHNLTTAIFIGTDKALLRWWRARDVEALPLFYFGQDESSVGTSQNLQRIVFDRISASPELTTSMANVLEHHLSPYYAVPMPSILWWTVDAAIRGNLGVIPEFLAMAKRAGIVNRELKARKRFLASENK
jgi:hypothetical protein